LRLRECFPTFGLFIALQRPENRWRGLALTLLAIPYAALCALSYELIRAGWPEILWIVYIATGLAALAYIGNGLGCALRLLPYYLFQKPRARRIAAEAAREAEAQAQLDTPIASGQEAPTPTQAIGSEPPTGPPCSQCGRATTPEPLATEHEAHTAYVCAEHGVDSVDMTSGNAHGFEQDQTGPR